MTLKNTMPLVHAALLSNIFFWMPLWCMDAAITSSQEYERYALANGSVGSSSKYASVIELSAPGQRSLILKQIRDENPLVQFDLVKDYLASTLGNYYAIPVNNVVMIAASDKYPHKIYQDRGCTLHRKVSGEPLDKTFPDFLSQEDFNIQQRVIDPDQPWQKIHPLPHSRQGTHQTNNKKYEQA